MSSRYKYPGVIMDDRSICETRDVKAITEWYFDACCQYCVQILYLLQLQILQLFITIIHYNANIVIL